jgi:hypothetical protein
MNLKKFYAALGVLFVDGIVIFIYIMPFATGNTNYLVDADGRAIWITALAMFSGALMIGVLFFIGLKSSKNQLTKQWENRAPSRSVAPKVVGYSVLSALIIVVAVFNYYAFNFEHYNSWKQNATIIKYLDDYKSYDKVKFLDIPALSENEILEEPYIVISNKESLPRLWKFSLSKLSDEKIEQIKTFIIIGYGTANSANYSIKGKANASYVTGYQGTAVICYFNNKGDCIGSETLVAAPLPESYSTSDPSDFTHTVDKSEINKAIKNHFS